MDIEDKSGELISLIKTGEIGNTIDELLSIKTLFELDNKQFLKKHLLKMFNEAK